MTQQEALHKFALRLGDNALIRSYRLSEWCSNAPILEEDLALTNFALDMIGRAQSLLGYAGEIEGKGRTADDLAYKRNEQFFVNVLMAELPNNDFAYTIARELFLSVYEYYYFTDLAKCDDPTLAAIATKTLKEVKYHMAHSTDWTLRLGDGTDESHARMQDAVNKLWSYAGEFFEADVVDVMLTNALNTPDTPRLLKKWEDHIAAVLKEATLRTPSVAFIQHGGRNGVHTEYMGHILSEMQFLSHAYPDASW